MNDARDTYVLIFSYFVFLISLNNLQLFMATSFVMFLDYT